MKLSALPIFLALVISLTSCNKSKIQNDGAGDSKEKGQSGLSRHEELASQVMDSMKEFATAVSDVSDLESAKDAAKKIGMVGDQFDRIAKELKPMDPPAAELKASISKKMEARDAEMEKVMGEDLVKTMQSLDPESQQVMQKAFADFFGKMDAAGKEFERHFSVEDGSGN